MTRIGAGRRRVSRTELTARAGWFLIIALMVAAIVRPAAAQTFSVLHEFQGVPNDGSGPRGGLLRDGAGNFFGTTFSGGGAGEGTVYKLTPNGQESVLFAFQYFERIVPCFGAGSRQGGELVWHR
jgi:uncharacterized repeat protein (TIGR03803 family)